MADVTLEVTSTQINNAVKKANAISGTATEINGKLNKADTALQTIPDTYVEKTDYAHASTGGVLRTGNGLGLISSGTNEGLLMH